MTQPNQPASDEMGITLNRIHKLGGAAEALFNRLYGGLNRSKQLADVLSQLDNMEVRNRHLREALKEKSIETQRLSGILASISEGIILQDTEGRLVMMNSAAKDLIGTQRNFWSTELGVLFRDSRDVQTSGDEIVPVGEAKRIEIGERTVSAQIAAISDDSDERMGTLMILRDVTDDLSNRMKNGFVTHISHELITPLAPMRVASEILLNTPEGKAPNRRMLEMIGKNVDILDRLVTEMLDMSAMTSGDFQIMREKVNLEEIVNEVVVSFIPDIVEGELEIQRMFKQASDLELMGDKKQLQWAISNLVRNAIQYTQPHHSLIVAVGSDRDRPHEIRLDIIDEGVGISPDDLPYVFNLFYRGDARTKAGKKLDPRGLGQGLFVAKTVAEAHNGRLRLNSTLHEGSTFSLYLPRNMPKSLPA